MSPTKRGLPRGVAFALGAALLFGLSTPAAKRPLGDIHPVLLAGLLYGASGAGLFMLRLVRGTTSQATLTRHDAPWLAGAVLFGGILGPVLLLLGLRGTPASTATRTPPATPRASPTRTSTPTSRSPIGTCTSRTSITATRTTTGDSGPGFSVPPTWP